MDIITEIKKAYPGIDNLSERTWIEVTQAIMPLMVNYSDSDKIEAAAKVFKSISGQLRYDNSKKIKELNISN